ncbi:unnamed protein product [Cunninghamella blakesleeana]
MYYAYINSTICTNSDRLPLPVNSCTSYNNFTLSIKNDVVYFYDMEDVNCGAKELSSHPLNSTGGCNPFPPISIRFINKPTSGSNDNTTKKVNLMMTMMIFMIIINLLFVHS